MIGKQKLSVVVLNSDAISITELVSAGNKSYRPCVIDSPKKREKPRPSGLGRKAQVPPTAEQACISIRFVVA